MKGVFRSINFNSESMLGNPQQKNTRLRTLLEDFKPLCLEPSKIEIKPNKDPADIIGDAYEYMIGEFASEAGKKAGSFGYSVRKKAAGKKNRSAKKRPRNK